MAGSALDIAPSIGARTGIGAVSLAVADLGRARSFYERVLGLEPRELPDGELALGAPGGAPLVMLAPTPAAPARDPRAPGLFHLAILLPTRRDLAHALRRIADAGWQLSGASDHLVSEALYLSDADGNGIELYRDRPREDWPRDDSGAIRMATLALDLRSLLAEVDERPAPEARVPPGARTGHVHLQVSDLAPAEAFYHGLLGFEITVRAYPGALFASAGGYHHHIGLNTWNSAGVRSPARGALGLRRYEILVDDHDELARVVRRLRAAGVATAPDPGDGHGVLVRDPDENEILLRPA
jgi:catechol 2,3-dioxygenase